MKKRVMLASAILLTSTVLAGDSGHEYLAFDDQDQLVVSGPFEVSIPTPEGARKAEPVHSQSRFMREQLRTSKAGFFVDDRFVVIEIETTDAPPGTLTYPRLPIIEMAGHEFHTRAGCLEFTQEDLDTDDDPLIEFIERQGFDLMPAVHARQLFVTTDDGTGEGIILFARRIEDCSALSQEFEEDFDNQFERFIASIQQANPTPLASTQ